MNEGKILSNLRIVHAIEILEYENKSFLVYDNKRNSEEKVKLLTEAINELRK